MTPVVENPLEPQRLSCSDVRLGGCSGSLVRFLRSPYAIGSRVFAFRNERTGRSSNFDVIRPFTFWCLVYFPSRACARALAFYEAENLLRCILGKHKCSLARANFGTPFIVSFFILEIQFVGFSFLQNKLVSFSCISSGSTELQFPS